MSEMHDGVEVLTDVECWELLTKTSVARLAVDNGGQPDIFPINYVVEPLATGNALVFRSGPGTKLAAAVLMGHIAFEIDGYEPHGRTAWSVVVKGRAHEVEGMENVFAAEDLPLFPWAQHPKPSFVRITPHAVTGRRFHVVDEVTPDASIGWDTSSEAVHPGASKMPPG